VSGEERLAAFEDGQREPSRPLLLRMARQYRRPLLTFYMSAAPRTGERGQDFRTLPPEHSRAQDALVDALIRNVRARQEMVRAVLEDEDEAVRLPFVASKTMRDDVTAVLQSIRETLNLDLDQYRGRKPGKLVPSGFTYLRAQAERVGIYVLLIGNLGSHHTSLDVETFRGFALADDLAPFIVINDQDAEGAVRATADGNGPPDLGRDAAHGRVAGRNLSALPQHQYPQPALTALPSGSEALPARSS